MKRVRPADRPAPESTRWTIKGVIRAGSVNVVFGPSGVGKTTLQVDIACSVAALPSWRSRKVRGEPVVFVAGEDHDGVHLMLHAWEKLHELERTMVEVLEGPIDLERELDALIDELKAIRDEHGALALVILDTLASVWIDESNESLTVFLAACRRIVAETGAAVLVTHHTGKDVSRGERGGSVLRCGVDLSLSVTRDGEVGAAEVVKVRGAAGGQVLGYTLEVVELGTDEDGEIITACAIAESDAPFKVKPLGTNAQIVLESIVQLKQVNGSSASVPLELVRELAYRRFTQQNKRQAFTRALDDLQRNPRYVTVLDEHVTLAPDAVIPPILRRKVEEIVAQLH